jgi:hypothetical protein
MALILNCARFHGGFVKILLAAVLFFSVVSAVGSAEEQQIFTAIKVSSVETDAYAGVASLEVTQDSLGLITGVIYRDVDGTATQLALAELYQGPQVISEVNGTAVVLASVENDFEPATGGHANVRLLKDIMAKTYMNFRFSLSAVGAGAVKKLVLSSEPNLHDPESDRNPFRGPFNYIFLKSRTFLGQAVGIVSVKPSFR